MYFLLSNERERKRDGSIHRGVKEKDSERRDMSECG
jgi:hypothetical protein